MWRDNAQPAYVALDIPTQASDMEVKKSSETFQPQMM